MVVKADAALQNESATTSVDKRSFPNGAMRRQSDEAAAATATTVPFLLLQLQWIGTRTREKMAAMGVDRVDALQIDNPWCRREQIGRRHQGKIRLDVMSVTALQD